MLKLMVVMLVLVVASEVQNVKAKRDPPTQNYNTCIDSDPTCAVYKAMVDSDDYKEEEVCSYGDTATLCRELCDNC